MSHGSRSPGIFSARVTTRSESPGRGTRNGCAIPLQRGATYSNQCEKPNLYAGATGANAVVYAPREDGHGFGDAAGAASEATRRRRLDAGILAVLPMRLIFIGPEHPLKIGKREWKGRGNILGTQTVSALRSFSYIVKI